MSRAPWVVEKPERALPRGPQTMHDTTLGWRMINPRMAELGVSTESMGETGENVAERYGISREDQDAFALRSHQRAVAAAEAGWLAEEIVPIEAPKRARDGPGRGRRGTAPRRLGWRSSPSCSPVFREGGSVTAGNASTLNDGAACLLIASEQGAARSSAPSRWPASSPSASPASTPPTWASARSRPSPAPSPPPASTLDQIDLVEINEAFASQVLASARELGIEEERLNVNGGAIALGHPLGCSGARLSGTLVRELRRRGGKYGIATMCVGVGQGLATVFEAV